MVMEIPTHFLLLLPFSIAAGVDLYLTLLAVGIASGLGLDHWTGPVVSPYWAGPVLFSLGVLFIAEMIMEARPFPALAWHTLQLLLRPLGAALLALFLLQGESLSVLALGFAMATVVAAFSHVLIWGRSLVLRLVPDPSFPPMGLKVAGTLTAIGLIALTLFDQDLGALIGTLLLLLGLVFGGSLHGAVRFGWTLLADRIWGIVSPAEWRSRKELPGWILDGTSFGTVETLRGARAGSWGVVEPRRFKDGWIIQGNQGIFFVFRQGRAPGAIHLEHARGRVEVGAIARTIQYRSTEGVSSALFLQLGLNDPESHK